MTTRTIGDILKEERTDRGVPLNILAEKTKIKEKYLQALEACEFDQLPSAVYVKSFIKAYADVLGLDHKPLWAMLRRDYQESQQGELIPIEAILERKPHKVWSQVTLGAVAVMAAFLVLISFVGFKWYQFTRPPLLEIYSPEEREVVAGQVIISGETKPEATLKINSQPVALQADGSFETEISLPREGLNTITAESTDQRGKTSLVQRTVRVEY
jgi:cytoskeleton protein RodZ